MLCPQPPSEPKRYGPQFLSFSYRVDPPKKVILEKTVNHLIFNVVPDRQVSETLFIKEYRIWDGHIECLFDREYKSAMVRSPDHLIFLSSLIHLQKLIYVYMCYRLDLPYDPFKPEVLKVWPTRTDCRIPKLVRERTDLIQTFHVQSLTRRSDGNYFLTGHSYSQGCLEISGDATIFPISKKHGT
jgi:hypothetical protein